MFRSDLPFEMGRDFYIALNKSQVVQMMGEDTEVKESRITLDDRKAALLSYQSTARNHSGEEINVVFLQYFILDDKTQIILALRSQQARMRIRQTGRHSNKSPRAYNTGSGDPGQPKNTLLQVPGPA